MGSSGFSLPRGLRDADELALPMGSGKTSPISAVDVARAVSVVLQDPTPHNGQIYNLTGFESHCLINNVTGELTVRSGAAIPNRIGIADGRTDQHGYAARDHGGGGRTVLISGADG